MSARALKKAIRFHKNGQLDKARAAYKKILRQDSRQPDALHFLGVLYHQSGQHKEAIKLIRTAIDVNPGYLAAHQNLGNIYQETGRVEDALLCYRKVIALNPSDTDGYNNLCIVLKHLWRLDEAIEAGFKATGLDPQSKQGWLSLANALKRAGRYEEAIDSYEQAVALDEQFFAAHSNLCHCTYLWESNNVEGRKEMAKTRASYKRWLAADPDNPVSRYMLAATSGNADMKRSPDDFITVLFDEFAGSFDQNLEDLEYRVPGLVAGLVERVLDFPAARFDILDAGCGTGLLATDLKPWARCLTGVDLSQGMLEKARNRGLYDQLIQSELTEFLSDKVEAWDLIICADTLCYFGELDQITKLMGAAMRQQGFLICSFERIRDGARDYRLNPNGRYSHKESYLRACFSAAGLVVDQVHHEVLRKEGGQPVAGLVLVAHK